MPSLRPRILVTGSTRGIGAAIRDALAGRGAAVVCHGASASGDHLIAADLAEPDAPDQLWDAALRRLAGRIDVLVNNAGVFEPLEVDADAAEWNAAWERTLRINLLAAARLSQLAVNHFRSEGGGRIVNIASRAAHRGDSPRHMHYAASKAGLVALTKSIARGFAREGVLAFAVAPGFTRTGMAEDYLASRGGDQLLAEIPLGRVAEPEEVASAVAYLALDAPPSMTGAVIDINGASYVR